LRMIKSELIQFAVIGQIDSVKRADEAEYGKNARTFTVIAFDLAAHEELGEGKNVKAEVDEKKTKTEALVFRCELPEAAKSWVSAINEKVELARTAALKRMHTQASFTGLPRESTHEVRNRNTQHFRL